MQNTLVQNSSVIRTVVTPGKCDTNNARSLWRAVLRILQRIYRRRHLDELGRLSNEELADIGLQRSDIYESYALGLNEDVTCHLATIAKNRRATIYRYGP